MKHILLIALLIIAAAAAVVFSQEDEITPRTPPTPIAYVSLCDQSVTNTAGISVIAAGIAAQGCEVHLNGIAPDIWLVYGTRVTHN